VRTPETLYERMLRSARVALRESLNASGRAIAKRVNALVIISSDECDSTAPD
jgi:hypothetical protein